MLEVRNLNAWYGDSHIVQDVSFDLADGKCLAILGRNGSAKTTTLRAILGYMSRVTGSVNHSGSEIIGWSTQSIIRRGISYVPENRGIFKSLTVGEHLRMAEASRFGKQHWSLREVLDLFPVLEERDRAFGITLSGGEQQMLAIARALICSSKFVILDEPSEGLAPVVIENIQRALQMLKQGGSTLLVVEQNYKLAFSLLDHACILSQGRVVFHGSRTEFESDPDLVSNYLGL